MPKTAKSVIITLMRKLLLIITAIILLSGNAYPYQAEQVQLLVGRDYFPAVKQLLQQAQKSIYIAMYVISYYPGDSESPVNKLVEELIQAKNRGVKVRVLLELSPPVTQVGTVRNDRAFDYLQKAGINVNYDTTGRTLHSKIVIVDGNTVVIGSHNWTKGSLLHNHEKSVIIESPQLAAQLIAALEKIPRADKQRRNQTKETGIPVPKWALTNPQAITELVAQSDNRGFDLYLYLLKKWHQTKGRPIDFSFTEAAAALNMTDRTERKYRSQLLVKLRRLQDHYKLIEYTYKREKYKREKHATITMLDITDENKQLNINKTDYFVVPVEYWEYNWSQKLSLPTKYLYLIMLLEDSSRENPDGYMDLAVRWLGEKYHTGTAKFPHAFRELRRYNLIEVKHGPVYPPADHIPGRYKLLKLYSQDQFQQKLGKLIEQHGKKRIQQAREYAKVIFEENDLDKVATIAEYIDVYGQEEVEYAINKVKNKATNNPKRSFDYVRGIIQSRAREKK